MPLDAAYFAKSAADDLERLRNYAAGLEQQVARLSAPLGTFEELEPSAMGHYPEVTAASLAKAEADYTETLARIERNKPKAERNRKLHDSIRDILIGAGLKTSVPKWVKDRSRLGGKWVNESASWTMDLFHSVPKGPTDTTEADRKIKEVRDRHAKVIAEKAAAQKQEETRRANAERERQKIARVADVAREVGLDPITATYDDVAEAVLSRCKYLRLARAGRIVRGDWSDWSPVEYALDRFEVSDDDDEAIVAIWRSHLEDREDGRCFRDGPWNYDEITSRKADPAAVALWDRLHDD